MPSRTTSARTTLVCNARKIIEEKVGLVVNFNRAKPLVMRRIAFLFLLFPFALSAQEESCTVLGVQELSQLYQDLIDAHAELQEQFALLRGVQETTDNGDGTITITFTDGTTFTTGDLTGPAGADGQDGLSAYQTWLALGNAGTEEEFISFLASSGATESPSNHGVFDSDVDGLVFQVPDGISSVSIELWGASGGAGGNICGTTSPSVGCNLCNKSGGAGGRALRVVLVMYNLAAGDSIQLTAAEQGVASQSTITCSPGFNGWNNWNCGPAPSGADASSTELVLNGEVLVEISGGLGGSGACIGCQGDGCYGGSAGANGSLIYSIDWLAVLTSDYLSQNTGSRLVVRY